MYKNNNDIDDLPLTDIDYDGVIYEPSEELKTIQKNKSKKIKKPAIKKKKAQNFNFKLFLWSICILGVFVFFSVSALVYATLSDTIGLSPAQKTETIKEPNIPQKENLSDKNATIDFSETLATGLIKNIDKEKEIITITDFKDNNEYVLKIKEKSIIYDKYNNPLSLMETHIGDSVDISFDEGKYINYIRQSATSFSIDNITNFSIENNILKFNNTTFSIDKNAICLNNNELYDITKLNPLDTISIKGNLSTIHFINIEKGTGILSFENLPDIKNATVEIDRDIYRAISNTDKIPLSVGTHKIVIKSSSTKPFVQNVNIKMGEVLKLDLSSLTPAKSKILISANVDNYDLFINGEEVPSTKDLELTYGKYQLKFTKESYNPLTMNILVENPSTIVEAKLEKPSKVGKLSISSEPSEAEVLVDGAFVGYTPITYKLPHGNHNVTLKKDGYHNFALSSVNIGKDESKFNITLHKKKDNNTENNSEVEDKNDNNDNDDNN